MSLKYVLPERSPNGQSGPASPRAAAGVNGQLCEKSSSPAPGVRCGAGGHRRDGQDDRGRSRYLGGQRGALAVPAGHVRQSATAGAASAPRSTSWRIARRPPSLRLRVTGGQCHDRPQVVHGEEAWTDSGPA